MYSFAMALQSPENTPETLKEAYYSLENCIHPNLPEEDSKRVIDLFAIALKNPKNDKTSLDTAASRLCYMDTLRTSMQTLASALHHNINYNANPSEALSNTYDFFYNISRVDAPTYREAHKQIADFLQSPKNDDESINHALEGLHQVNKNLPEESMGFNHTIGFFAVIDSGLNRSNPPIYQTSKEIMSTLPKLRDRSHAKALNKLNDILETAITNLFCHSGNEHN